LMSQPRLLFSYQNNYPSLSQSMHKPLLHPGINPRLSCHSIRPVDRRTLPAQMPHRTNRQARQLRQLRLQHLPRTTAGALKSMVAHAGTGFMSHQQQESGFHSSNYFPARSAPIASPSSCSPYSSKSLQSNQSFIFAIWTNGPRRHERTHTRPYECRVAQECNFRGAEQRDRVRHEATHGIQPDGAPQYYCPHGDCDWHALGSAGGFGVRLDNAKRHITRQHADSIAAPIRIDN
jgi:hypothetical protein